MIDRTCRLIRILLHEADLDQFTLRLAKLSQPSAPGGVRDVHALSESLGLPLRRVSGRRRSHVSRFGLGCVVTVHITLKPILLMASSDGTGT